MVFVLNADKQPLAPTHPARARQLLDNGKAAVYRTYPFTIILRDQKDIPEDNKEYRLKVDYGSKHTGLAILQNNNVLWLCQLDHRTNVKENLQKRSAYRRRRRSKNLRYRQPRFLNRTRKKGWLPPSLESRVGNIKTWVSRLQKLIPLTNISYENVKFDTQLMQNAEISGVEYQQGTLKGYEVREYLLEKWSRKCAYCGIENVPLQVEHIISKARGGSNRVSNLTISCKLCNDAKGTRSAEEFGHPDIQSQAKKSLKGAAIVTATRWKVYETLSNKLPTECGTGARTKMQRTQLGLPKDHCFDACCIGASTPSNLYFKTNKVLNITAKGRGKHCRTNVDKYGFPRGYLARQKYFFGFQTGDMVVASISKGKFMGIYKGEVLCRKTGSFDIKVSTGRVTTNYKFCKLVQEFDGYKYEEKSALPPHG